MKTAHTIYVDALALIPKKKSGVGMTVHHTLVNLVSQINDDTKICLVVPLGKAKYLQSYLADNVMIKTIPLPARGLEILLRLKIMPPVDWFLGTGVYVFPNYRNWPLWSSRSLTYVYDLSFMLYPEVVQPKNRKYLQRYIRTWTNRADKIITISQQVRNELEKHMGMFSPKIQIIPCGVNTAHFYRRGATEIAAVKKQYAIPHEKYLLFVGNIEPRKNLTNLLIAYEHLPVATRHEYGLVIIGGDGWLNEAIHTEIQRLQAAGLKVLKVDTYVSNNDLPALYSGASLLVHPAIYEGFGMTPLEAMACQTPVVISDLPAHHEVVADAGIYVDPHNWQAITKAIATALTERNGTKVRKGHIRAEQFTWQSSAAALLNTIREYQVIGPRKLVMLHFAKNVYKSVDLKLRTSLGDKVFQEYRPDNGLKPRALYARVVDDFIAEQPTLTQVVLLRAYLGTKHVAVMPLKFVLRRIRSRT